jgi:hypothetical protein
MDVPAVIQYCTSEEALEEQMFSLRMLLVRMGIEAPHVGSEA